MFLSKTDIIILAFGTVLGLILVISLLASSKYEYLIEPLDPKMFRLKEIYTVGFLLMDISRYKYNSKRDIERKRDLSVIYESKYADYYLKVCWAQRVSLAYLLLVIGFPFAVLAEETMMILIFIMFAWAAFVRCGDGAKRIIEKRTEDLLSDFPNAISKLALLTNAGMILKEAWEMTAYTGNGPLYDEMKKVIVDMANGYTEIEAYTEFGNRCMISEIRKFTSTIVQGITKGNRELVLMLRKQSSEVWESRKHQVRQLGAKASSKLLFPICIMFIGILIMIMVPIFANLGV